MSDLSPQAENCRWIFAYGSLMWRPDFEFELAVPGKLIGYHRRLSVFSHHYRGTDDKPGLVLGLDRGGSCTGLLYKITERQWPKVLGYVRDREMIGGVYREVTKKVAVGDTSVFEALTYVVKKGHPQYAPVMSTKETLNYIQQGRGLSGTCAEYVLNTVQHLRSMGVRDTALEKLAPHLTNQDK